MRQLIPAVLITIAVVAFGIANSHHVQVSFVFGAPVKIRLIFLLMCTFFLGTVVPIFFRIIQQLRRRRQLKQAKQKQQAFEREERDLVGL